MKFHDCIFLRIVRLGSKMGILVVLFLLVLMGTALTLFACRNWLKKPNGC